MSIMVFGGVTINGGIAAQVGGREVSSSGGELQCRRLHQGACGRNVCVSIAWYYCGGTRTDNRDVEQ